MADITNVNLLFQRKIRGIAPLCRFAVQEDGGFFASVPDEMESRTFHILRYHLHGKPQTRETYNVETLRRTEVGGDGTCFVGASDDHCYLFRAGRKTRFLTDRRASYTDIALAADGQRFAAAFCDLLASGHSLALGEIGGRALWTKDIAFPIRRIAVDRALSHIAVAGDTGELLLLDPARNTALRYRQEASLTAVATSGLSRTVFAGGGGVGAVNADGQLMWFTELVGEPVELALDAAGQTTAVLLRLDDSSGRLVLLSEGGLPTWDMDFDEARPTGLSLSANGRFVGVTLRDGTTAVYELQYGERLAALDSETLQNEARAARESGNLQRAIAVLRERLTAVPSDVAACSLLSEILADYRERTVVAAETALAVGDYREADACLADYLAADPLDAALTARRREIRTAWAAASLASGRARQASGDSVAAEMHYLEAIAADPLNIEARNALADTRHAAAEAALARGRALMQTGQFADAITALTEAQRRGASGPETTQLLREARIGEAFALGNALYQDRQYAAALFQFKKVLRLDPDNAEAQQKVGYAQNFLQDTQLNDRFTRLE